MRPANVRPVQPVNTATFYACLWNGHARSTSDIRWMAEEFGWKVNGEITKQVRGRNQRALLITARNRKQYTLLVGDWVIALGANGSIRVCSDKQFRQDYKEAGQ